ncbi:MAG: M14 family metallocarboxypeptidase [Verrucomicrobiales bacterium]|jgi:hypothetical protein|nr:M14 family metallocarboxypeptidase [Verrucomicrobiales bacterium]
MDVLDICRALTADAQRAGFRVEVYGEVNGLPLPAFTGGAAAGDTVIYLSAGIHGDEPAGVLALRELFAADFFDGRARWLVCPLLNPTGLAAGTRENFQGLDLNRDYRRRASSEVAAHCRWLERQPPFQLALSLHEDWETSGFYLYEINTSRSARLGPAVLAATLPVLPAEPNPVLDGHAVDAPGYIFHRPEADDPDGWPEAIYHARRLPLLSCTFETPSRAPLTVRVQTHVAAVRAAVEKFLPPRR